MMTKNLNGKDIDINADKIMKLTADKIIENDDKSKYTVSCNTNTNYSPEIVNAIF